MTSRITPRVSTSGRQGIRPALAALVLGLFATWTSGCKNTETGAEEPTAALDGSNAAIVEWSEAAYDAFVNEEKYGHPMRAVRVLAMVHLAQHDALAAIRPTYASFALQSRAPNADPVVAAAVAAHDVLLAELPGQKAALDARLARNLEPVPTGAPRELGVSVGRQAAATVLHRRIDDGTNTPALVPYTPEQLQRAQPGTYLPIPPVDYIAAPGWRSVRPFALQSPEQFRVSPHPSLDSAEYAAAFEEVKRLGVRNSADRTADQTSYAKFWYEFSDIGWNRVARVVAVEHKLGLQDTARLFALLNVAMSDAYVAGWDSKFHYDFWRPTTAIRAAASDGNTATAPDPQWEAEEVTPPVQDYPSTHSALGDAAAEVLASVFGDATTFAFTSTTAPAGTGARSFKTFHQAADENADSRVQAGLHFRFATRAGQALGRQIGAWVLNTALQPRALASHHR
jgi:hypothetical protein